MGIIVFCDSGDGGTRTTSSALLAAGASEIGFQPLHVQVLTQGGPPALVDIREVPFGTMSITAERGETITGQLRACARSLPKRSPVIVDMPAQDVRETLLMLSGMEARLLLPLGEGASDIERVVQDYREIRDHRKLWKELNREGGRRLPSDAEQPPAWLLPVGWPTALGPGYFATLLHDRDLLLQGEPRYPVIHPGIPGFDPMDVAFTDWNDRFVLTDQQRDAAASVARALCGGTARAGSFNRKSSETDSRIAPWGPSRLASGATPPGAPSALRAPDSDQSRCPGYRDMRAPHAPRCRPQKRRHRPIVIEFGR